MMAACAAGREGQGASRMPEAQRQARAVGTETPAYPPAAVLVRRPRFAQVSLNG